MGVRTRRQVRKKPKNKKKQQKSPLPQPGAHGKLEGRRVGFNREQDAHLKRLLSKKQPGTKAPKSKSAAGVPAAPPNSFALPTSGISSAFLNDYANELAPRSYQ